MAVGAAVLLACLRGSTGASKGQTPPALRSSVPPLGPRGLMALGPIFCSNSDQGSELWEQGEGNSIRDEDWGYKGPSVGRRALTSCSVSHILCPFQRRSALGQCLLK